MSKYPVLNDAGRDLLFRDGRSHNGWCDEPVSEKMLRAAFDLAKMCPTSANCSPMRVIFVRSETAKEKLRPCLSNGNQAKTLAAPVTAILGIDFEFYEHLPRLFPHDDAKAWFVGDQATIDVTATRNASLRWDWIAARCPDMTAIWSIVYSFQAPKFDRISFATWDMAIPARCLTEARDSISKMFATLRDTV
jgi:3-hydroxypropanoate dehydrogenase